jgi:hypothetical protein
MRSVAGGAGFSILAAVLALAGFKQIGGKEGAPAADVAAEPKSERDARVPLAETSDRKRNGKGRDADPCDGGKRLLEAYRDLYGERPFRHLIVLVPDPAESGGPELLDFVVEGVDKAVSEPIDDATAYVHEHRWIPWTDAAGQAARCWEKQAGLILYRPLDRAEEQPPLVVLLVGETPTWGLRPAQFTSAIDLIRDGGAPPGQAEAPYLVLGPTYSGTAASLSAMLHKPPTARSHVRIVSGTATTAKARQILAPKAPFPSDPCTPPSPFQSELVSYESVSATDTCLLAKLKEFLLRRGGKCASNPEVGNIALFTETSTTYASVGTEEGWKPSNECFQRWTLPPDLASIREGSEKGGERSAVAVHQLALGSTLDRLSNGKIRFAGIVATDHRDVLYLARRFRQQLPDVRLFTLAAKIQYLDEKAAPAMNGMLVVHSAPRDRHHAMSLKNELVHKIYHAGRRLLADDKLAPVVDVSFIGNGRLWDIDDFPRLPPTDVAGATAKDTERNKPIPPVIWQFTLALFAVVLVAVFIVVVLALRERPLRHGRFWALIGPCSSPDLRRQDLGIGAALLLVCAGPVLLMFESMVARQGQEPGQWAMCVVASILVMTSTCLFHFLGYWSMRKAPAVPDHWYVTLLPTGASIMVVAISLYIGCGQERRATFYLLSGGSPILVGLIAMASYALTLWCARTRLRMLDTHRFQADATKPLVGMDPPIAQALGEVPPVSPACGEKWETTGLADIETSLLKGLYHPWRHAWAVPLAINGLMLVTLAVPMWIKPPHTLEPDSRNVALIALGVFAALTMSVNLAWFVTTWMRLVRFLNRLASFPAVAALSRLPDRRPRSLEEQLAWSGSEATQLIYAVKILGRLAEVDWTLQATYRDCRTLLRERLSREACGEKHDACKLVNTLLETSGEATARRASEPEETRKRIDDLAASLIDLFVPRYVRHLRLFFPPMVLGCLCSVFLASLYFVQPQRLIATGALFWVAVTVVVALVSYVSLDMHPVLSAVAGSTSGKVSSRFTLARKIAVWAVVPVAGYLAADHPEFPLWVSSVLDLVAKSLR